MSINLVKDGTALTDSSFSTSYMTTIIPGDSLSFAGINVSNTGDLDVYALIKCDITITISNHDPFEYTKWYNLNGVEVYSADIENNTTPATLVKTNQSVATDISYVFDGDTYNNSFKSASIDVTLSAYGIQSFLQYNETYPDVDLYASYLLVGDSNTYTRLTYLESSGTQYIDTGVLPSYDLTYELNFTPEYSAKQVGVGSVASFFGARSYSTNNEKYYTIGLNFGEGGQNAIYCWRELRDIGGSYKTPNGKNINEAETQTINKIELRSDRLFYFNNTLVSEIAQDDATSAYTFTDTIYLFGRHDYGTATIFDYMKLRVYSLKMYKAGTLIRDFIPVLDGSGVACMYDLVENKFYYNQGTGTFNSDSNLNLTTYSAIFNANCDEQNYASDMPDSYTVPSTYLNGNINRCGSIGESRFYTNDFSVGDVLVFSCDIEWSGLGIVDNSNIRVAGSGDITAWVNGHFFLNSYALTTSSGSTSLMQSVTINSNNLKNNYINVGFRIDYVTGGTIIFKNFKIQKMPSGANELPDYFSYQNVETYYTTDNQIGSNIILPSETPTREGYTFLGWFTAPEGGTEVSADTIYTKVGNWQVYAQWRGVSIDPNGGTYNGSTLISSMTAESGTTINLATPTREGYTFTGFSLVSGTGSVGQKSPNFLNSDITKNLITDGDGTTYWNYIFNVTRTSSSAWRCIQFSPYSFVAGHQYQLTFRVRINSINVKLVFRHSRCNHDYFAGLISKTISASCNWTTITLTTTFEETFNASGTTTTTSPRFEIYTEDLKATGTNGDIAYFDFDIKDICVIDITDNTLAWTSSTYTFGERAGKIVANWVSKTSATSVSQIIVLGDEEELKEQGQPVVDYFCENIDKRKPLSPTII